MCVILIAYVTYLFCHNIICVNCDVCECVHVYYEYNITLYNLIIRNIENLLHVCILLKKVNDVSSI